MDPITYQRTATSTGYIPNVIHKTVRIKNPQYGAWYRAPVKYRVYVEPQMDEKLPANVDIDKGCHE